jgi:uncharacterized protein (TIGR03790 family)
MSALRVALAATVLLAATGRTHAGGGPENVFVVVNARGAKSKEVANHYIAIRHIPSCNVFYVAAPVDSFIITGEDFRDKILLPVLVEIDKRGLRPQIDYVVYSCEFPCRIDCAKLLNLPNDASPTRPTASLTGATYLYQFVEQVDPNLPQLNTNFYCMANEFGSQSTRAFRSKYQWRPGGARVAQGGLSYMLSAQLGCVLDYGSSIDQIKSYLNRAAAADGTRPAGTFYYMKNGDVRSTVRDAGYPAAITELKILGLKAELGAGVVPVDAGPLLGLTTGSTNVRLTAGTSFAPGALVDNLTSQGAVFAAPRPPQTDPKPQTRIAEYLNLGAGGASGTVIEPMAVPPKFPSPALHVHYARGSSMAEAFYQSVQGPFQLQIMGDPLCQPWALIPQVTVNGIAEGATISGQATLTPSAKLFGKRVVDRFELFIDGVAHSTHAAGETITLDTTQLADGHHELRVVAIDGTPVETQGRWIANVVVANGKDSTTLSSATGASVAGTAVVLNVQSTVDGVTVVMHNEVEVGRVKGRQDVISVPVDKVGRGLVTFEARTLGETPLRSAPLTIEIR